MLEELKIKVFEANMELPEGEILLPIPGEMLVG